MSEDQRQRLDKYLWFARVVKTRTLAAKLISGGNVRVNTERITSPSKLVAPGDVLTIAVQRTVRVLKINAPGVRRGPFVEAKQLYEEIGETATPAKHGMAHDTRPDSKPGPAPRPDKRARRAAALLKRQE